MASRKIRDEVMLMTISVNSDPAQQAIYELRKENVAYAKSIDELKKQKDLLVRRNKENAVQWDALTKSIKENESAISTNKDRMEELRRTLDVNKMTMFQLKKEAELLKRQLSEVVPGTATARQYEERLAAVRDRMGEVNMNARNSQSSFRNLAERFNHYSGIVTAVIAVLVGFGISIQNVIDRNNKMADAMSGVEKNVGMTRKEVEQLTRSFSDLDTRTSKLKLLDIAIGGGRLGVAKEDIREFVEVADKAIVALGDSWKQTPDKIAESMGKVTTLYGQLRDLPLSESVNKLGSALNELAADGAASEQNVNDFAARVGSLPEKLKPTIADALGLGAAFEESELNAERAGTAYTTFVRTAANNVGRFAEVMRLPVDKVKEMINTNPTEFFLKFSEGLKGMDATDLAKTLDYLKMNDQYVTSIVGAASEKNERFRETLKLSNDALSEATSLTDEFNKVNNNSAAIYEKIQKKIAEVFTSKFISTFINETVLAFGRFIGVVEDTDGYITSFRTGLLFLVKVMTVAMVTMVSMNLVTGVYNGLMKSAYERVIALTIVEKSRNVVTSIGNALNTLYTAGLALMGAGYALVTGNIAQATFAMRGFTAAIAANPVGAVVTLITAAASAYFLFNSNLKETEKTYKSLNEIQKEGVRNAASEISQLDQLYKSATNVALGKDKQRESAEKLQKLYPQIFGNIDKEIIMNGKARDSYLSVRDAVLAASKAKAAQVEIDKITADSLEEELKVKEKMKGHYINYLDPKAGSFTGGGGAAGANLGTTYTKEQAKQSALNAFNRETEELVRVYKNRDKKLAPYLKFVGANESKSSILGKGPQLDDVSPYKIPNLSTYPSPKNTPNANAAAQAEKQLREELERKGQQAKELAVQIEIDKQDALIEVMAEGLKKELALLDQQYEKRKNEIEKKEISDAEINSLDKKIEKASAEDKILFAALKATWLKNNQELENLKLSQLNVFENKKQSLTTKYNIKEVKDADELVQRKIANIKRWQNEDLASINSLANAKQILVGKISGEEINKIKSVKEAKQALEKYYQNLELDVLTEHLQEMMKLYEGIDLSILSEEQKADVVKHLEEIGDQLAKTGAEKQKLANPTTSTEDSKKLNKGNVDILGMSPDDWTTFYENLKTGADGIGTATAAVQALQNAFSVYYGYVQAQEQAQMAQIERSAKRREKRFKDMLDSGQINQEQYEQQVQALNEETERKKAKLEYESAKRQRNVQIGQIIANTAIAIMNAAMTQPFFPLGLAMTGVAAAIGAVQLATVMKTPLPEAPGYEDGFGMDYDMRRSQDGKKFRVKRQPLTSGLVKKPTHFIAGENNRVEMVIDEATYKGFSPNLKTALHSEIGYSRGYEGGYYPYLSENRPSPNNVGDSATTSNTDVLIANNTAALNRVAEMKPRAYIVKDLNLAKDIIDITEEYNSLKNSARK